MNFPINWERVSSEVLITTGTVDEILIGPLKGKKSVGRVIIDTNKMLIPVGDMLF